MTNLEPVNNITLHRVCVCDNPKDAIIRQLNLPNFKLTGWQRKIYQFNPSGALYFGRDGSKDMVESSALKIAQDKGKQPCVIYVDLSEQNFTILKSALWGVQGTLEQGHSYTRCESLNELLKFPGIAIQMRNFPKDELDKVEVGFYDEIRKAFEYKTFEEWRRMMLIDPEIARSINEHPLPLV